MAATGSLSHGVIVTMTPDHDRPCNLSDSKFPARGRAVRVNGHSSSHWHICGGSGSSQFLIAWIPSFLLLPIVVLMQRNAQNCYLFWSFVRQQNILCEKPLVTAARPVARRGSCDEGGF